MKPSGAVAPPNTLIVALTSTIVSFDRSTYLRKRSATGSSNSAGSTAKNSSAAVRAMASTAMTRP
jgi:hypothetical protein